MDNVSRWYPTSDLRACIPPGQIISVENAPSQQQRLTALVVKCIKIHSGFGELFDHMILVQGQLRSMCLSDLVRVNKMA